VASAAGKLRPRVVTFLAGGDERLADRPGDQRRGGGGWQPAGTAGARPKRRAMRGAAIRLSGSGVAERFASADDDGDGEGVAPLASNAGSNRRTNADVYLTCGARDACIATRDPSDRAHSVVGTSGMLLAAAVVRAGRRTKAGTVLCGSTARRYPRCLINGAGYSDDSVCDATHARQQWLADQGLVKMAPSVGMVVAANLARMEGRMDVRAVCRWKSI
jgi:hypothetical protein